MKLEVSRVDVVKSIILILIGLLVPFSVLGAVLAADHKIYYVSADGTGNGSSADTPMNLTAAKKIFFNCGDRVLFKRGDVFYDEFIFDAYHMRCTAANEYVYFSDYGDANASYPIFSLANIVSDAGAFTKASGYDNIWVMDFSDTSKWSGYGSYSGNVGFYRTEDGSILSEKVSSLDALTSASEFAFFSTGKMLYIKSGANPVSTLGTLYVANGGVQGTNKNPAPVMLSSNSDVSHFWVRDSGGHGVIQASNKTSYINFHDSIVSDIGGAYEAKSDSTTRLGNGIEFYNQNSASTHANILISNNIVRNVFDSGFTIQGDESGNASDVSVTNNIFVNVGMNIEMWGGNKSNVNVKNNYFWNAGQGWGWRVRSNPEVSTTWYFGKFVSGGKIGVNITNNKIFNPLRIYFMSDGNVFTGSGFASAATVDNNTYYMGDNSVYCVKGSYNDYSGALSYCGEYIKSNMVVDANSDFIVSDSVIENYLHNYTMENSNNFAAVKQYLDKVDNPVLDVKIEALPQKLSYAKDKEQLDLSGGKLLVTYIDYSQKMVDMSEAVASGFSNTTTGDKTVTLTYAGANLSFGVKVVASSKVVNSISVKKAPTKTQFVQGSESLDLTGGELTVNYADGTSRTIAMTSPNISVSGYSNTSTGAKTLTLSYMGKTTTTSVSVVAKAIGHIELAAPTYRLILNSSNRATTATQALLRIVYNDGSSEYLSAEDSAVSRTPTHIATGELGEQTVTLTYKGHTATYQVYNTGKQISEVSVGALPKTTYLQYKDGLDLSSGSLAIKYTDGTTGTLPMENIGVKAYGFDNTNEGYDTLRFFVGSVEPGLGAWKIFTVPLGIKYTKNTTPRIQTISMKTLPKTEYSVGDSRNLSGGVLRATYSNGTTKDVALTGAGVSVDALDTSTEGVKYLTVSYDGKMTTYPVTVSSDTPPAPVVYTLTVKHLAKDGTVLAPQLTEELESGSSYSVSPDSDLLKIYNATANLPTSGTITSDLTIVFTYEKKVATVNVKHVDESGEEVAPTESFKVNFGDRYTAKDKASTLPNYTLIRRSENYTGIAMSTPIDVTFTYRRKAADLSAQVNITSDGTTIGNDSQKVGYEITFDAESSNYIGEATVKIVNELPYAIDEAKSRLDGGTYDAEARTLTWTASISATASPQFYKIQKQIELQFIDVPRTDRIAASQVQANIALGSEKTALASAAVENEVAFMGEIVVRYVIAGTNTELANGLVLRGLVGDSVVVVVQSFEGYELVRDVSGRYSFDDTVRQLTFEYEKIEEPSGPDTPVGPDNPEDPDQPSEPDNPDEPDTPDEPGTPDEPDGPNEPDSPDGPDSPEEPDTPSEPDDPDDPVVPDTPTDPDTPGGTNNPNQPGGSETPEGGNQNGTNQGGDSGADGPFKPNTGTFTSSIRSSIVSDILVPILVVTLCSSITGIIVLVGRERRQNTEN